MYEKLADELAFYEYNRANCERIGSPDIAEYWQAKIYGLSRGIQIATGSYPAAICHGETVKVHIGEFHAVKFFD